MIAFRAQISRLEVAPQLPFVILFKVVVAEALNRGGSCRCSAHSLLTFDFFFKKPPSPRNFFSKQHSRYEDLSCCSGHGGAARCAKSVVEKARQQEEEVEVPELLQSVGERALDDDNETPEASYAKAKQIRAARATTALKTKLTGLENAANNMGGSFMEPILLLREESERKAEARRAEEQQRRRDDVAAREARLLADKAGAKERRRQDKLDMEERVRRDREEARVRTQEVMLVIQAFTKKS